MPWVEALLRGTKVYARAKDDGTLDARGGRVEIRYKKTDTRAYRAAVGNLSVVPEATLLPDDACDAGSFVGSSVPPSAGDTRESGTHGATNRTADRPWVAYTDGACSGNPGPAGVGLVVIAPDGKIEEGFEYLGKATNNIAELTAILRALEAIPPNAESIIVHTDSKYAIGVLSQGWKAKVNTDLIAGIKRAAATRARLQFTYVPGHAGVPMNERADELARTAIQTEKVHPVHIAAGKGKEE